MTSDEVVAETVRAWVDQSQPGDRRVAERAAFVALITYREGRNISEACRQASAFVQSWINHPAHLNPDHDVVLRLVS
jgi:predicted nucleic acid-binding protein